MRWKLLMEFFLTILVFFVVAGDVLLPQPYRGGSQQLKTNINHFLIGLMPNQFPAKVKTQENNDL